MDTKQMMSYFPRLLRDLYRLEGHTSPGSYRLYLKLDPQGKVVEPATPLGIWDGVVEAILPRTVYLGGGKRFPGPLLDRCATPHLLPPPPSPPPSSPLSCSGSGGPPPTCSPGS